jgi:hypothetical protein
MFQLFGLGSGLGFGLATGGSPAQMRRSDVRHAFSGGSTCTVDGAATKQIANLCEGPLSAFYELCGFP